MADILVTWFSRSGSTERLARALAARLGADAEPILPETPYAGGGGFARALWQSLRRHAPPIRSGADPTPYRLVVLGVPVWAGRPAAPARTWLRQHGPRVRSLAAFCVSGSGGAYDEVFAEIGDLAGRPPAATLSLAQRHVLAGETDAAVAGFVARLTEGAAKGA